MFFEDDTVAKVAVSKANLRVFCFGSCWALPLSLLLRCFALWRNANLAGGFAGRFWLWFCLFGLFLVMICLRFWTTRVLYTTAFHCLRNVRTVPSANRPNRRGKKHLPRAKEASVQGTALNAPAPDTEPKRSPEEEARDILAVAAKNQPEDGPSTRRAAVRGCKYLRAMVSQYETTIQAVHSAARTHTQRSKGTVGPAVDYRPQGEALPVISADLTSELLHCLSTLPDPWPLAKITIDMEKPSQWVSKLCRLLPLLTSYAKRTVGLPSRRHVPDIAGALRAVQAILPKLEVKMIEFLAEWMVTLLMPASHVLESEGTPPFLYDAKGILV